MALFQFSNETGFLNRADEFLKNDSVSRAEHEYLEDHFIASRDRVSALATIIGSAGTVLLAFLTIIVTAASGVNAEATKATEAAEMQRLVMLRCESKTPDVAACDAEKDNQAKARVARAKDRQEEVARVGETQVLAGGLLFAAFLASILSHLINPLPPWFSAKSPSDKERADGWSTVRDRYRSKRLWIVAALLLDGAAVLVLILFALGIDVVPF